MIRRFYVHNFRCLENFELPIAGHSSVLLIGKNGSGKTAVGLALEILQKIARGTNRVSELVKPKDFTRGRTDVPIRFEIEVELDARIYEYVLAFEFLEEFKELRVFEEKLVFGGEPLYTRKGEEVHFPKTSSDSESRFAIAPTVVTLSILQSPKHPAFIFHHWLARMLILRPVPILITGESGQETLQPDTSVKNFGAWFSGLLAHAPAAYVKIDEYLKQVMNDFKDIKNPEIGKDYRSLAIQFSNEQGSMSLPFEDMSDGEKCFMICALVLASNEAYGPLFCFWDEPDNYLALDEVGHFVLALRKAFQSGGQFIATSHNPEAIRSFSDENTLVLFRRNHFDPTTVRLLNEIRVSGDLINALIRGDVEP